VKNCLVIALKFINRDPAAGTAKQDARKPMKDAHSRVNAQRLRVAQTSPIADH
jgi:hypothetical protein